MDSPQSGKELPTATFRDQLHELETSIQSDLRSVISDELERLLKAFNSPAVDSNVIASSVASMRGRVIETCMAKVSQASALFDVQMDQVDEELSGRASYCHQLEAKLEVTTAECEKHRAENKILKEESDEASYMIDNLQSQLLRVNSQLHSERLAPAAARDTSPERDVSDTIVSLFDTPLRDIMAKKAYAIHASSQRSHAIHVISHQECLVSSSCSSPPEISL